VHRRESSVWLTIWAAVLLIATAFVIFDPQGTSDFIRVVVHEVNMSSLLGIAFVAVGAVNIGALLIRIVTLNKE
jgi:hypothetical protein